MFAAPFDRGARTAPCCRRRARFPPEHRQGEPVTDPFHLVVISDVHYVPRGIEAFWPEARQCYLGLELLCKAVADARRRAQQLPPSNPFRQFRPHPTFLLLLPILL